MVLQACRHYIIIKKDIKNPFCNIRIAPHVQWLLGFFWSQETYQEICFFFGLAKSIFIFNLFAKTIYWMLQFYFSWANFKHYLDNFIYIFVPDLSIPKWLQQTNIAYQLFIYCLGILYQNAKNIDDTVVSIFGL